MSELAQEQAEERERQAFVEHLINADMIDGDTARGIALKYVHEGLEALSTKQRDVLEKYVIGEHLVEECSNCHQSIPMSEQIEALDSGICGYCEHMLHKND